MDGSLCNGCGQCCSRLCAPFGDTGVFICQPTSGCRVNGDLCRQDTDCCGAAGSGLPGDGNVSCQKEPGAEVGICRNPLSCNPHGNVCHYQDYACSISSSRNNCCGATGNSGACQLDPLGVPRCNGLGGECRAEGDTCASASDCCDGKRCVADAAGQLRCAASDDPTGCIPSGGSCTVNGDCCAGVVCTSLPGSTQGVCGSSTSEPPPGGTGSGGTGGSAGTGGSGGEAPPDSETPPTYSCALFGQACSQSSDCCSNIPCTNGACVYPLVIR